MHIKNTEDYFFFRNNQKSNPHSIQEIQICFILTSLAHYLPRKKREKIHDTGPQKKLGVCRLNKLLAHQVVYQLDELQLQRGREYVHPVIA